jgi:hypothetical protein
MPPTARRRIGTIIFMLVCASVGSLDLGTPRRAKIPAHGAPCRRGRIDDNSQLLALMLRGGGAGGGATRRRSSVQGKTTTGNDASSKSAVEAAQDSSAGRLLRGPKVHDPWETWPKVHVDPLRGVDNGVHEPHLARWVTHCMRNMQCMLCRIGG